MPTYRLHDFERVSTETIEQKNGRVGSLFRDLHALFLVCEGEGASGVSKISTWLTFSTTLPSPNNTIGEATSYKVAAWYHFPLGTAICIMIIEDIVGCCFLCHFLYYLCTGDGGDLIQATYSLDDGEERGVPNDDIGRRLESVDKSS